MREASLNSRGLSSPAPPAARSPLANNQLGQVTRNFWISAHVARTAAALALLSVPGAGSFLQRATTSDDG